MAIERTSVAGVILAGGQSRRMGGGDKGLLMLGGSHMLAHVIERLAPQVGTLVLSANGDPARFATFGLPVLADAVPGFRGPLAGILAGMQWALTEAPALAWIASATSDVPFLPRDVVERLAVAAQRDTAPIALARSDHRLHPVIGLWSTALAGRLATALADGEHRVGHWAMAQGAIAVDFAPLARMAASIDPFFNANTPEELAEAQRLLALGLP